MNPTTNRPSTVSLNVSCGQEYQERKVNTAFKPGALVRENSAGELLPQSTAGQKCGVKIATEDCLALRGGTVLSTYAVGEVASYKHLKSGDEFLGFLKDGQNLAKNALCMAAGDGSFTAYVDDTESLSGNAETLTVRPNHALVETVEALDASAAGANVLCMFRVL